MPRFASLHRGYDGFAPGFLERKAQRMPYGLSGIIGLIILIILIILLLRLL